MMEIASLVLFSDRFNETTAFYRTLGVPLVAEVHDDGPVHLAADVGGVHVAIWETTGAGTVPAWRHSGSTFPGFYVDSLDDVVAALASAPVLVGHEVMPWGCRVVVQDPDGRPVEINQREHCPQ
jgi:hypothetical protein